MLKWLAMTAVFVALCACGDAGVRDDKPGAQPNPPAAGDPPAAEAPTTTQAPVTMLEMQGGVWQGDVNQWPPSAYYAPKDHIEGAAPLDVRCAATTMQVVQGHWGAVEMDVNPSRGYDIRVRSGGQEMRVTGVTSALSGYEDVDLSFLLPQQNPILTAMQTGQAFEILWREWGAPADGAWGGRSYPTNSDVVTALAEKCAAPPEDG